MGRNTTIALKVSCAEDDFKLVEGEGDGCFLVDGKINDWLKDQEFLPLIEVGRYGGGTLNNAGPLYAAGYKNFPDNDFAEFVMSLPWKYPEDTVLVLEAGDGSDDPTRVYRPLEWLQWGKVFFNHQTQSWESNE